MKEINLAYIPARSQSKGIKDKNIISVNNKPLMAYTIKAAIDSNCFDMVFVSTDSPKYASLAVKYEANADFLRSKENSSDTSTTISGIIETVNKLTNVGYKIKTVTLLQPTSPLRTKEDIINAWKLFNDKNATSVVSLTELDHPSYLINKLGKDNNIHNFVNKSYLHIRRQDFNKNYYINGAIYILRPDKNYEFYAKDSYGYIMDKSHSIDVNDEFDLKMVKFFLDNK